MATVKTEAAKQYYATSSLVIGYALCSSLLAVINKFAITKFNYPGLLTALQYLTSAAGVWILGKLGFLYHDPFSFETAKKFLPAATVFYLAIFTNTNLLRHANVDTFIVFRSLTPLLVAVADTAFRKQPCPSKLTFLSLVIILGGAVGYVITDSAFTLTAYSWAFTYLITITTEMVYIKHIVTNLGLNTWGYVFYNNLLSLAMSPLFWVLTGEYADVFTAVGSNYGGWFDFGAFVAVSLSCIFGLLISFFGFAARKAISATAFTVTGVVNKFLTVAINVLIWDKHATPFGLLCLLFTLVGGVLYQQSVAGKAIPLARHESAAAEQTAGATANSDSDEEPQKLGISRQTDRFLLLMERPMTNTDIVRNGVASATRRHENGHNNINFHDEDRPAAATHIRPSQPSLRSPTTSNYSKNASFDMSGDIYGQRHRSPLNSGFWISIELYVNLVQITAAIVVLSFSRRERPQTPLFAWIIGYTIGCVASIPYICRLYIHRNIQASEQRFNKLLATSQVLIL